MNDEKSNKWGLNTTPNNLELQERKDVILFLIFLDIFGTYETAIAKFKEVWLNNVYELPPTTAENYNSVKCVRSLALKRVKLVFKNYIVSK